MFNPSASSSFKNLSTTFQIEYGSGAAAGYVAQDVVEMAGFSVSDQGFGTSGCVAFGGVVSDRVCVDTAVVNQVTQGLLTSPVSGLLGLAWQTIASSGETPFWQTLASNGVMDSALFAVQLRR